MKSWLKKIFSLEHNDSNLKQGESILVDAVEPIAALSDTTTVSAEYFNGIGDSFFDQLDFINAEKNYRKALSIKPEYFDAHINLGLCLDEQQRFQESEACFKEAITCKPNSALARFNLGVSLKNQHYLTEAENLLLKAIEIWPPFYQCHNVLGEVLLSQNRIEEAILCFKKAVNLASEYSPAHRNLGESLVLLSKFDEAKLCFLRAIELSPTYFEAHYSLASLYSSIRQFLGAERSYRRAIELRNNSAFAHCNLGHVLVSLNKYSEAKFHLKKAIEIDPLFVEAICNLGIIYNEENCFEESDDCYQRAIVINPNFATAHACLGVLLMRKGKIDDAIVSYRRAISLDQSNLISYSNLLMTLSFYDRCSPQQYKYELEIFATQVLKIVKPFDNWICKKVDRNKPKLKIGFVSGDFFTHPVGFFLESVVAQFDLDKFELYAYANHPYEDKLTARLKSFFKEWTKSFSMTDGALAQKIHQDGIHILIDLSGHTAHNRLTIFAWKPAPIQVSWLGYFASTGIPGMDYVISDPVTIIPEHHDQFTEEIWYIPNTRLCFTAPENADKLKVSSLPALRNGFITIGCFQGMAKLTDEVLSLWGDVFRQLPTAQLRLQNKYMNLESAKEEMLGRLALVGIKAHRVILAGAVGREEYFLDHATVDMILDTFPYTGGTTTCEALWMGVPTLTLNGDTMLKRQGNSLLSSVGLNEWVAENKAEYVSKAVYFANRLDDLSELRCSLREKVLNSPLFDAELFAQNFESALLEMWFKKVEENKKIELPLNS